MATRNQVDVGLSGETGTGAFAGSDSPEFTTQIQTPAIESPTATDLTITPANGQAFVINLTGGGGYTVTITGAGDYEINLGSGLFVLDGTTGVDEILDEDNMVSDSATALATQQSIKAYVDNTAGAAFTNQDVVTGSRAFATDYQNTTGKPMFVTVSVGNSGSGIGTVSALTDANTTPTTTVALMSCNANTVGGNSNLSFMVLAGNYYRVNSDTTPLQYWVEWY